MFEKAGETIKRIPTTNIAGTAGMTVKEWLAEMFFPFLPASYSSVSGNTLVELGTTVTAYTLGSSFTRDASDSLTAATASYRLIGGNWNTPTDILSNVNSSATGNEDPVIFSHSHDFTSISLTENSEFAFTFTFNNNGTPRVLDGMGGSGPKRTLTFQALCIQGKFSSEFPTATELLAKVKPLSSSALSSFNITAPSTEYGYFAIPVRFGKYINNLDQGGRVLAGWEIVTSLSNQQTVATVDENDNTLVVDSTKYHSLPLSADTNQNINYIIYKTIDPLNTGATLGYTVTFSSL